MDSGRSWDIQLRSRIHHSSVTELNQGWTQFRNDLKLKEGDILEFSLVRPKVLKCTINQPGVLAASPAATSARKRKVRCYASAPPLCACSVHEQGTAPRTSLREGLPPHAKRQPLVASSLIHAAFWTPRRAFGVSLQAGSHESAAGQQARGSRQCEACGTPTLQRIVSSGHGFAARDSCSIDAGLFTAGRDRAEHRAACARPAARAAGPAEPAGQDHHQGEAEWPPLLRTAHAARPMALHSFAVLHRFAHELTSVISQDCLSEVWPQA